MAALDRTKVLSTPEISVGGTRVSIIPNSFKFSVPGEVNVRSVSAGGLSHEIVAGTDAATFPTNVTFSLANTAANLEMVRGWKEASLRGEATTMTAKESTGQYAFDSMFQTNAPEPGFEAEGNIDLEWMGRALF